jgi:putative lipoic acid-binding regulatory protein
MSEESLLTFPCTFAIKAMGKSSPELDLVVVEIVRRHSPNIGEGAVSSRPSKGGNYTAITVVIEAHSRQQLDAIYLDLNRSPHILMTL